MPVHRGSYVKNGQRIYFYQWGNHGKRYEYLSNNLRSRNIAKQKAELQGRAIRASGWTGRGGSRK